MWCHAIYDSVFPCCSRAIPPLLLCGQRSQALHPGLCRIDACSLGSRRCHRPRLRKYAESTEKATRSRHNQSSRRVILPSAGRALPALENAHVQWDNDNNNRPTLLLFILRLKHQSVRVCGGSTFHTGATSFQDEHHVCVCVCVEVAPSIPLLLHSKTSIKCIS